MFHFRIPAAAHSHKVRLGVNHFTTLSHRRHVSHLFQVIIQAI